MSILDTLLGQVNENASVQNLAAKVGLTPDQVESAVAALAQAHGQEGPTVHNAAEATGLPADKLGEIVGHIGGEGSLGQFASLVQGQGGVSSILGGLSKYLGS
jgi:hypothetical protein